jgi:glucosamine-6-phosphate deaminase
MKLNLIAPSAALGREAAQFGAAVIRAALASRGESTIIVATGASQFALLETLVLEPDIDWSRVTVFHLDEYINLPESHPASFRLYLRQRFLAPLAIKPNFIPVNGEAPDLKVELDHLNKLLSGKDVDLCFAGIGENGHLAFNDPPADFEVEDPYIVVTLDEGCRRQQWGEGWFPTLEDVPHRAISMSIRQIMRSKTLLLTIPDSRKAAAVQRALEGPIDVMCPASIVQRHPNCTIFLDAEAASKLTKRPVP